MALQLALALVLLVGFGPVVEQPGPPGLARSQLRSVRPRSSRVRRSDRAIRAPRSAPIRASRISRSRTPPSQKRARGARTPAHRAGRPVGRRHFRAACRQFRPARRWRSPLESAGKRDTTAVYFLVTPNLFATLRTPIVHGREFTDRDVATSPWVAIVNETCARRFWPGEDPIGKRIRLNTAPDEQSREVVGVVRDIPYPARRSAGTGDLRVVSATAPALSRAVDRNARADDVRDADNRTTLTALIPARAARGFRDRSRSVDRGVEHVRIPYAQRDRSIPILRAARQRLCGRGDAPRGDRHLWGHGVFGQPAHAGNRHPAGAGGRPA